jgi:hypothetical protein
MIKISGIYSTSNQTLIQADYSPIFFRSICAKLGFCVACFHVKIASLFQHMWKFFLSRYNGRMSLQVEDALQVEVEDLSRFGSGPYGEGSLNVLTGAMQIDPQIPFGILIHLNWFLMSAMLV